MNAHAVSSSVVVAFGVLAGCSDEHTPMHEVLNARFESGAVVDLGDFVPGRWSAICLHGQYETVRGYGPTAAPLKCSGDSIASESPEKRISYVSDDGRCFSIAMPKSRLDTRTDCYRERDGFKFRMEDAPGGKMIRHVSDD